MIPIPELEALRSLVQGPVSGPEDPGYALEAFNPSVVQRPEAVLAAVDTADVQNAVRWAADAGIPVGVQATGHGAASAMDEGLLISTSGLQDLRLDPDAGTVALGAGVRWRPCWRRRFHMDLPARTALRAP